VEVEVKDGRTTEAELPLSAGAEAVLRVNDGVSGHPLDAQVIINDLSGRFAYDHSRTGASLGTIRAWLRPGSYVAVVSADGYATQRGVPITVPGPEVQVVLRRGGTLVITSRSGAHIQASLRSATGERLYAGPVTQDIPAGTYVLEVHSDGVHSPSEQPVTIAEGKTTTIEIE
jgi:hypothetical protein